MLQDSRSTNTVPFQSRHFRAVGIGAHKHPCLPTAATASHAKADAWYASHAEDPDARSPSHAKAATHAAHAIAGEMAHVAEAADHGEWAE